MNERDAMTLLATANPVQADELTPLDVPDRFPRRVSNRRLSVAVAVVAVAAAALAGIFAFNGHDSGRGPNVNAGNPTGAHGATGCGGPTGVGPGYLACHVPISLTDASAALGAAVVLPDSALVGPSDAGTVTKNCPGAPGGKTCEVKITFPAQVVFIRYLLGGYADPLKEYKASDHGTVVYLSGTPALLTPQNPNEDPSSTWSQIEFQLNGVTIIVNARDSVGPTAQAIAQSIVDRSK